MEADMLSKFFSTDVITVFSCMFLTIVTTSDAKVTLPQGNWMPTIKSRLENLIQENKNKSKIVIFDFDNTMVSRDIGEATFATLAIENTIHKNSPYAQWAPDFTIDTRHVSLATSPNVTAYYEDFLEATKHIKDEKTPYSNAYAWIVQIMAGLTPQDVISATKKAYKEGTGAKDREDSSLGETMVNGYRLPFFYPEMIDLAGTMISNGFNVYVITASNVWSVRYLVTKELNQLLQKKYGKNTTIAPDHVLGVSTLLKDKRDGKLYKDESLVKENKAYRNLEISELQQYELLYELSYPLPAYEGKVAMIFKHITHEHPFFIAGDSPNDHQMLEWAENRLWIARLEKKDYQAATAELIKNSDKEKWLIQPTLYKKSPGFVASEKELETRLKLNTAEKEKFTQTIQVFKNEKALEQF